MKFRIIIIGKLKNKNLRLEIDELSKRVSRLEVISLKEVKDKNIEIVKKKEFVLFRKYISSSFFNILLWEFGSSFSSRAFYEKFKNIGKPIQFIITGPYGACEELKNIVDLKLSLSQMTFTHEQAFYMLIEQIYRFECFEKNIPYTK